MLCVSSYTSVINQYLPNYTYHIWHQNRYKGARDTVPQGAGWHPYERIIFTNEKLYALSQCVEGGGPLLSGSSRGVLQDLIPDIGQLEFCYVWQCKK